MTWRRRPRAVLWGHRRGDFSVGSRRELAYWRLLRLVALRSMPWSQVTVASSARAFKAISELGQSVRDLDRRLR